LKDVHRLLVVGGGVAGLDIATHLAGRRTAQGPLAVTLIDREMAHIWKPMLHTIAAGTSDVYQQQTSYVAQAREHGFVFHPGEVASIDRNARTIRLNPWRTQQGKEVFAGSEVPYDTLILALGSRANDFGIPGVAEYCHTIDSRDQAIAFNDEIRVRILESIKHSTPIEIAIVGGGATGVELAAELVELATSSEYYGAQEMSKKVKISLLESGDHLLAAFPMRIAEAARQRLEAIGITVHTSTSVTAAEPTGFRLQDGGLLKADLQIWAAGVKAPDVLSTLTGLELTRNNQLVVGPTLRSTRDEHIYAVGDCASLTPAGQERPLPPTAQVAHQQARYLADRLPEMLAGRSVPDFRYHDFGSLVSLGGYDAFGSLGKFGFFKGGFIRGRVAQLGHAVLYRSHQVRLHGFWRGTLLWIVDRINAHIRPTIRLD
jgi:NADH dehydrogenase